MDFNKLNENSPKSEGSKCKDFGDGQSGVLINKDDTGIEMYLCTEP